ncbi:quinone-dependent dihydroorotate dehydrogenase [Brevibacillus composti]|uniref:Dihydroorotate dehydrogenase (quinone) n=1 Tax=Brevibacillus composti TaxID=2796470 RepID=A0A7T5JPG1_9BACL|nr:quinone-dependent dihydroorotate dehydrogenase [Brevibacillus composti]QQE75122.1 quinone-dependent dihydroorotate dehydrogenase [Brevibacillus composti]QUO42210.1 quinone-dependent dihydroorotate dehydrogenase [Brevibacillus composti]
MYPLVRKFLFQMDAEEAHEKTVHLLKTAENSPAAKSLLKMMYQVRDKRLENKLWGISFPNPVGLAAGFDKNAEVYHALAAIGFGFVEVGTITPQGQPGNPKPRLFRLVEHEAIINRMGFNNLGAYLASQNLIDYAYADVPIGINIGKNKMTPNEEAASDYSKCLDMLYNYGHYFVINVSSPNTPNLRDLQETESLRALIRAVREKTAELEARGTSAKPILLKVAPDMADEQMRDVVRAAVEEGLSGIIATNTTLSREPVHNHPRAGEAGGLSGKPLEARATAWVKEIFQEVGDRVPIIGVGGIFTGEDAYRKIRAGASLVQVYSGMAYQGPGIAKMINKQLLRLLEQDGFTHISEAIGADAR